MLLPVLLVAGTAVRVWAVARIDDRRPSDAIVVLGASQYDGRPSSVLEARLEHAKTLYEQGVAPRVITVGGNQEGDRFTEAGTGKTYLNERGVPNVIALEVGSDTLESIEAVDELMERRGWTSAVLVSDPWHSLRARRMATDQGIDAVTSPTRAGPSVRTRSTQLHYIARETAGYLYYRLTHLF